MKISSRAQLRVLLTMRAVLLFEDIRGWLG
jgi:hypothetical protein